MDLEREVADLKRRVDLHDTLLAQQSGQFEFISTQLREVQRFMHAKFADHDRRFDEIDRRLDRGDAKTDSMLRILAEHELRFEQLDGRLEQIDGRFVQIDRRFEQIDGRLDQMDRRLDRMDAKIDALPRLVAEMIANR